MKAQNQSSLLSSLFLSNKTCAKLMSTSLINMQASPVTCKNRVMTPSFFVLSLVAEGSLLIQMCVSLNIFLPWFLTTKTFETGLNRFLKSLSQRAIVCSCATFYSKYDQDWSTLAGPVLFRLVLLIFLCSFWGLGLLSLICFTGMYF